MNIPGPEGDRYLALVRDAGSDHAKGGLFGVGCTLNNAPELCLMGSLNQKTSIVVKEEGDDFYLLLLKDKNGVTGDITPQDKEQQIPLTLERINKNYGLNVKKLQVLEVELEPNPAMEQSKVPVTIKLGVGADQHREVHNLVVHYTPGIQALALMGTVNLPDVVKIPGTSREIKIREIEEGDRLFFADVFTPAFERSPLLVTPADLRYARSLAKPFEKGWEQYGPMMPGFASLANRYADVAPSPDIRVWLDGKPTSMNYIRTESQFLLVPSHMVDAQRPPRPEA